MKKLSLRPYHGYIWLCESQEELEKTYTDLCGVPYEWDDDPLGGRYIEMENDVWLVRAHTPYALAHEFSHVLLHVFGLIGHNPTIGDGEPFCYMLSQLLLEADELESESHKPLESDSYGGKTAYVVNLHKSSAEADKQAAEMAEYKAGYNYLMHPKAVSSSSDDVMKTVAKLQEAVPEYNYFRHQTYANLKKEHISSAECWCEPEVDYIDPETGVAVYVHKQGH